MGLPTKGQQQGVQGGVIKLFCILTVVVVTLH